jgi:predicted DNA-binding protein
VLAFSLFSERVKGLENIKPPVRVNTRIAHQTNEWLDRKALEMALTKSALINIAIENYRKEIETVNALPELLKKMKELGIDI